MLSYMLFAWGAEKKSFSEERRRKTRNDLNIYNKLMGSYVVSVCGPPIHLNSRYSPRHLLTVSVRFWCVPGHGVCVCVCCLPSLPIFNDNLINESVRSAMNFV